MTSLDELRSRYIRFSPGNTSAKSSWIGLRPDFMSNYPSTSVRLRHSTRVAACLA